MRIHFMRVGAHLLTFLLYNTLVFWSFGSKNYCDSRAQADCFVFTFIIGVIGIAVLNFLNMYLIWENEGIRLAVMVIFSMILFVTVVILAPHFFN